MSGSKSVGKEKSYIPTREELVRTASNFVPILRERAQATEDLRNITEETIADLKSAGLHKYFTPKRYGGFEMDWGTHMAVSRELGRGCGSTSWISSVVFANTWLLARFPEQCQEEFWPSHPDAIVSSAYAGNGTMTETDGGYILDGEWKFSSGINHADCVCVAASISEFDPRSGEMPKFRLAMLLPDEFEVLDTWYSEGLKGSGSNNFRLKEQFVPAHRTILTEEANGPNSPGARLHDSYIYKLDFTPHFFTLLAGPIVGTALGALEQYCEITKTRMGQMFKESVAEQVPVQVRVGESVAEIEAANLMVEDLCQWLHQLGHDQMQLPGTGLLTIRRTLAYASKLCLDATTRLSGMMGVSGQTGRNPVQRHFRDARAISNHGGIQWDASMGPTGSVFLGVKTGDPSVDNKGTEHLVRAW